MKLSAPVYRLKRQAKILSRAENIPLHQALDRVAVNEGFARWSLLVARLSAATPARALLASMSLGDLVLLGARPGHGKTQLSLELIIEAIKAGRRGAFFTLEYNETDIRQLLKSVGAELEAFGDRFEYDLSDAISADYVIARLSTVPAGTVAVIDYLQLLDQKREHSELAVQVRALKSFAAERGLIIIFISQINRFFDSSAGECPGLDDVRLPNPVDLKLFNKACFLHYGELRILTPAQ